MELSAYESVLSENYDESANNVLAILGRDGNDGTKSVALIFGSNSLSHGLCLIRFTERSEARTAGFCSCTRKLSYLTSYRCCVG